MAAIPGWETGIGRVPKVVMGRCRDGAIAAVAWSGSPTRQCPPRPAHNTPAPYGSAHVYKLHVRWNWCLGCPIPLAGRESSFSVWSGLVAWVAWAVGSVRPAHRRTLGSAGDLRVPAAERSMCRHGDQCTRHAVCGGVVVCEQLATPALWYPAVHVPPMPWQIVHTGVPALQCMCVGRVPSDFPCF
jgi:hypothetical protein